MAFVTRMLILFEGKGRILPYMVSLQAQSHLSDTYCYQVCRCTMQMQTK